MSWFIVVIVYLTGVNNPDISIMTTPFNTKIECQNEYNTNKLIQQDIEEIYPSLRSMSIVCMDKKSIIELQQSYKQIAI
jgi:hypothetical protein